MKENKPRFTSDRRSPRNSSWRGSTDWSAGALSGVNITNGRLVSQRLDSGPYETSSSAVYLGELSDDTTHRHLTNSGKTLYSMVIQTGGELSNYDEYAVAIDVSLSGTNRGGSGRYPSLGFKLTTANGDVLFRYSDVGQWTSASGNTNSSPDGTVGRIITINRGSPVTYSFTGETAYGPPTASLEPPITAEFTSSKDGGSGGGSYADAFLSCDATVELYARSR